MLIFMEYCAEGTIEEVAKQGLGEAMVRRYTGEILQAVAYLHEHDIVHRDIKGMYPRGREWMSSLVGRENCNILVGRMFSTRCTGLIKR